MVQPGNSSFELAAKLLLSNHWRFSRENIFERVGKNFQPSLKDLYVIAFHIQLLLIGYYLSSLMMQVHTYLQMSSWLCLLTKLKTIWRKICTQFTLVYLKSKRKNISHLSRYILVLQRIVGHQFRTGIIMFWQCCDWRSWFLKSLKKISFSRQCNLDQIRQGNPDQIRDFHKVKLLVPSPKHVNFHDLVLTDLNPLSLVISRLNNPEDDLINIHRKCRIILSNCALWEIAIDLALAGTIVIEEPIKSWWSWWWCRGRMLCSLGHQASLCQP